MFFHGHISVMLNRNTALLAVNLPDILRQTELMKQQSRAFVVNTILAQSFHMAFPTDNRQKRPDVYRY